MPLAHRPKDGYSEGQRQAVFVQVSEFWGEYATDCAESDTRPDLVDFAVWLIHVKGFKMGLDFARDETEG